MDSKIMEAFKYMDMGKNEKALYLLDSLVSQIKEDSDEYYTYLNLYGYVYSNLKQFDQAVHSYEKYLLKAKKENNIENLHIVYHQFAMVMRLKQDYTSMLEYLDLEVSVLDQYFKDDALKYGANEYEKGLAYLHLNQLDKSKVHMEKSLKLAKKSDDLMMLGCAYKGKMFLLRALDNERANLYKEKAKACFSKLGYEDEELEWKRN